MNRRSFLGLGGAAAVTFVGGSGLAGYFSRASEESLVQVASAAEPVSACRISISSSTPDSTADLVNVVRAYMKDNGLLQSFTGSEHFHEYMKFVYDNVIDAADATEELAEARHMIVDDEQCQTPDEPDMEQCTYAEAWKLHAHLEALQIYPADGSVDFDTLEPVMQYKVANSTVAFVNLVNNLYPTLAQTIWPDDIIQNPIDKLWARAQEQETMLVSDGVCIKPMPAPVDVAPATPEQPPVIRVRNTPGLILRA